MKALQTYEIAERLDDAMHNGGVFLNVKSEGAPNTMTISWGTMGIAWSGPVFMTMVRHSRHTHGMLEKAGCFTISIPRKSELTGALSLCGIKSGRDGDKFALADITAADARQIEGVVVAECDLHIECRVVCATEMDPARLAQGAAKAYRDNGDYHTLYFGEVIACYSTAE